MIIYLRFNYEILKTSDFLKFKFHAKYYDLIKIAFAMSTDPYCCDCHLQR